METVIYVLAGMAIGYVLGRIAYSKSEEASTGLAEIKQENLDKIMSHFVGSEEITNDKVQALLGVSDATATRYMDELEKRGSVVQIGETGKNVTYRKA